MKAKLKNFSDTLDGLEVNIPDNLPTDLAMLLYKDRIVDHAVKSYLAKHDTTPDVKPTELSE